MLKPAQLYRQQLGEKHLQTYYDMDYMFYECGPVNAPLYMPDRTSDFHVFASVEEANGEENVLGVIHYHVSYENSAATYFSIINYEKGNMRFLADALQAFKNIFEVYHLNRVEWTCYADNPALPLYRRFIKEYGGKECAYYRQYQRLLDNELHDLVVFEVLADEYHDRKCSRIFGM